MSDYYITPEDIKRASSIGISEERLKYRVYVQRWDKQRAIITPVIRNKESEWNQYKELAKKNGISNRTFLKRVNAGWSSFEAASKPPMSREESRKKSLETRKRNRPFTDKEVERAAENGISYPTLLARVTRYKWDKEKAINTPVLSKNEVAKRGKEGYLKSLNKRTAVKGA